MDRFAAAESLKSVALEKELPDMEYALFGVRCPYCGKMDRIRPLEPPDRVDRIRLGASFEAYESAWGRLGSSGHGVGVCWFCRNVVVLPPGMSSAEPVFP